MKHDRVAVLQSPPSSAKPKHNKTKGERSTKVKITHKIALLVVCIMGLSLLSQMVIFNGFKRIEGRRLLNENTNKAASLFLQAVIDEKVYLKNSDENAITDLISKLDSARKLLKGTKTEEIIGTYEANLLGYKDVNSKLTRKLEEVKSIINNLLAKGDKALAKIEYERGMAAIEGNTLSDNKQAFQVETQKTMVAALQILNNLNRLLIHEDLKSYTEQFKKLYEEIKRSSKNLKTLSRYIKSNAYRQFADLSKSFSSQLPSLNKDLIGYWKETHSSVTKMNKAREEALKAVNTTVDTNNKAIAELRGSVYHKAITIGLFSLILSLMLAF